MLLRYHFGILLMVVLTLATTTAELSEPCKFDNKPVEDTYCRDGGPIKGETVLPPEYRCDDGLTCCAFYTDVEKILGVDFTKSEKLSMDDRRPSQRLIERERLRF